MGSIQQEFHRVEGSWKSELTDMNNRLEGSLREEIQSMARRFEQILRSQEEAGRKGSSSAGKQKDTGVYSPSDDGEAFHHGGGSPMTGNRPDWRFRKLEMPLFDGTNPDGWILKAEHFFHFNQFSNEEKMEAAVISFEGDALLWYQWESKKHTMVLWEEMKILLLKHFRPKQVGSLHE